MNWKMMSEQELQSAIEDDKKVKRDWVLLDEALAQEKVDVEKAISIYEGFVDQESRYPLPYRRLPIIYHKRKDYENELRVLTTAVRVFERDHDDRNLEEAQARLDKLTRK